MQDASRCTAPQRRFRKMAMRTKHTLSFDEARALGAAYLEAAQRAVG
jgi:hypothetical protein